MLLYSYAADGMLTAAEIIFPESERAEIRALHRRIEKNSRYQNNESK